MNSPTSTHPTTPTRFLGLLSTSGGSSAAVLRLTLAAVLFPHGAQKLLGWFGGYGFSGTRSFLTGQVGLPGSLAVGIILLEFFGPILLLVGLLTRPVALAVIGLMIGAIATVHWPNGFFMNWAGVQPGEGFEYHLLVIAIGLALAVQGGGPVSFDRPWPAGARKRAAREQERQENNHADARDSATRLLRHTSTEALRRVRRRSGTSAPARADGNSGADSARSAFCQSQGDSHAQSRNHHG